VLTLDNYISKQELTMFNTYTAFTDLNVHMNIFLKIKSCFCSYIS